MPDITGGLILFGVLAIFAIIVIARTARVVPQQQQWVVERLGKYSRTLDAGFHILMPFVDVVKYKHSLKEIAIDIPEQVCITKDNVQVGVDGVVFLQVMDAKKASYGINNYEFGIIQLAQTTLRSEIGKIDLDKTFEERDSINGKVVTAVDQASDPWGVKVLRYEIKNINPPRDVLEAMEKQMRAEREKRATVLTSEGERDARINRAEAAKREVVLDSEAVKAKRINEAQGQATAIREVAEATADGLNKVRQELTQPGGEKAMELRIAEQYIPEFGKLAGESNTMIIPADAADVAGMMAMAKGIISRVDIGPADAEEVIRSATR